MLAANYTFPAHPRDQTMATPAPTAATVMGLLEQGRRVEARQALDALAKARPRDAQTWIVAAWVEHESGNVSGTRVAIERASRFSAPAPVLDTLRAAAANAEGSMDEAAALAERAIAGSRSGPPPGAVPVLAQSLHYAGRVEELSALLEAHPAFRADPRGQLLLARVHRRSGRLAEAEALLRAIAEGGAPPRTRRIAWSELAKLLDSQARYDEAFAAATSMHKATSLPFDTGALVQDAEAQLRMAERDAFRGMRVADGPPARAAFVCSLPRSGSTMIEQMLDRHPDIVGVGESPAIDAAASALASTVGWPGGVLTAPATELARLRTLYEAMSRQPRAVAPQLFTLDKSVQTWRRLPAVAALLPGARVIRLVRDPRDLAVSLYLSALDTRRMGWNASLGDIRRVLDAERRCTPRVAQALGIATIEVRYEDVVRQAGTEVRRMLDFLGVPWNEDCLSPEGNTRVAITLSNEQVRRPLNTDSIGRWRHYAHHFDESWAQLARLTHPDQPPEP